MRPGNIRLEEVPRPHAGVGEAVIRITLTTICGTDLHIVRGEYPVRPGLVIGHEPVGVIEELGEGVTGYNIGDRVLVGAITPCGQCRACLSAQWAQCGHGEGIEAVGGWRFGNTINGAQAEYLLVPSAQANLAKIPDELSRGHRFSNLAFRFRHESALSHRCLASILICSHLI
jgi:alcohol dehydrogenase